MLVISLITYRFICKCRRVLNWKSKLERNAFWETGLCASTLEGHEIEVPPFLLLTDEVKLYFSVTLEINNYH